MASVGLPGMLTRVMPWLAGALRKVQVQPLEAVLVALTFVTGIVDAVTYLDLGHVFAANMTGNVVLLGFALVGADQVSASASLVSLGAFLVGAGLGGRLARALQSTQQRWIVTSLSLEGGLLLAAMLCAKLRPSTSDAAIVGILALAMGIRNATMRRVGIPDLTTTVLTMLLTVLAADTQAAGGGRGALARRLSAVAAMLGGAASGALLLRTGGAELAIGVAAGVVAFVIAGYLALAGLPAVRPSMAAAAPSSAQ